MKLKKYQKVTVIKIIRFNGRALLSLEMGLGKTACALYYLKLRPEIALPALVVCPSSVKWVWRNEAKKFTKLKCQILNGRTPRKFKPKDITIINYDILDSWKNILRYTGFQTLILDECHYIKAYKAHRTKAAISIGKKTPHILALSGTPLTNRPKELFQTLRLLRPDKFNSFVPYAFRYCGRRMTHWGWDDNGATHLEELHNILKNTCMIRKTKKQVLKELPDKQRTVVPVSIEKPAEYRQAEDDFTTWLSKLSPQKALQATNAEKLVQIGYLKRLAAQLKMKAVIQWIDDYLEETDEKVVIFAYHKPIIQQLQAHFKKYKSVVIDGSVPMDKREAVVKQFQNNKDTRVFIGQIVAAGTGITLTAASTVIFVELDWVPGNHIQCEDRTHRIGQKNNVNVYYLVAKDTMEEDLCEIIQKKATIISKVLDGKKVKDKMNVFDLLIKSFEKRLL